jgi:hypothetical protein
MVTVRRTTNRSRTWSAWVGNIEDLIKIGREAEVLVTKRRNTILGEFDSVTEGISPDSENYQTRMENRAERRKAIEDDAQLRTSFTDGTDTVSGALDDVIREVDRRSLKRISFTLGGYYLSSSDRDSLSIVFRKEPKFESAFFLGMSAVELEVTSPDVGWAREAVSHLSEQIDLGVPWWRWIHNTAGKVGLGLLFALTLCVIGSTIAIKGFHVPAWKTTPMATFAGLIVLLLGIAGFVSFMADSLRNRMFPPFEIVVDSQSTGTRFIIFLSVTAVGLVVGIFVNLLTANLG